MTVLPGRRATKKVQTARFGHATPPGERVGASIAWSMALGVAQGLTIPWPRSLPVSSTSTSSPTVTSAGASELRVITTTFGGRIGSCELAAVLLVQDAKKKARARVAT